MKTLYQIGIVLGICLLGEVMHSVLPFPFPGSVISMVLLFLFLLFGVVKPQHIQQKTDFMLKNMAFFFIPAGVSILDKFQLLQGCLVSFLLVCFFTYLLTFAATAYTVKAVAAIQKKHGGKSA